MKTTLREARNHLERFKQKALELKVPNEPPGETLVRIVKGEGHDKVICVKTGTEILRAT